MSMSTSGRARRSFIIGSRLWPAGDEAGLGSVAFEQGDGVVDAGGALVFDRRGYLHGDPPLLVDAANLAPWGRRWSTAA